MADYGVRIILAASSGVPRYTAGMWVNGVARLSGGATPGAYSSGALISCSQIGERADLAGGGNIVETSEAEIVIESNQWQAFQAAGASIYGATVEVGTLSGSVLSPLWAGVVTDAQWSGPSLSLSVESIASRRHKEIPKNAITNDDLDGLTVDPAGSPVPIIYGAVERMNPVRLQSSKRLSGMVIREASGETEFALTAAYPGGTNTVEFVSIVAARNFVASSRTFEGTWYEKLASGVDVYMDVISGTGSGQRRKLVDLSNTYSEGSSVVTYAAKCGVTVNLVTPLDRTSVIRLDVVDNLVNLAIGDEASSARVYAEANGAEFDIPFSLSTSRGFAMADASPEFWDGEKMASALTVRGSQTWSVPELVDETTKSGRSVVSPGKVEQNYFDGFCRTRITSDKIPKAAIDANAKCKALFSFDISALPDPSPVEPLYFTVVGYVLDFYGAAHEINYNPYSSTFRVDKNKCNAFGEFNSLDGDPGNYTLDAIEIALPIPLSEIESITTAIVANSAGVSGNQFVATVTAGSNVVWPQSTPSPGFAVGQWIRQRERFDLDYSMCEPPQSNDGIYKAAAWRQILYIDPSGGLTVSDTSDWDVRIGIDFIRILDSDMRTVIEREAAIAFELGEISADAEFLADASGRQYSSTIWPTLSGVEDPEGEAALPGATINAARSAALDMMYRDLELGANDVDQGAFLALDASATKCVLNERKSSREYLGQMAREFGWVFAHDYQGRETATDLLGRVGSTDFDVEVTNAEIIAGSIEGVQATSIEDVVTLPQVLGRWTQADGARLSYGVKNLSIDPSALTSGNFRDHVFGFSEFSADVVKFYRIFYTGKSLSGAENAESIEIKMHDGRPGYDMMRRRFAWISRRKQLLTFSVTEGHAARLSHVGQRVKVSHRRYANGGLFGVLAGKYWSPMDGTISLTVMIDPPLVDGGETEGGWGFNWGNDWGEHT